MVRSKAFVSPLRTLTFTVALLALSASLIFPGAARAQGLFASSKTASRVTYINLSPEQLKVSADPTLAKQEKTDPLFAPAIILPTPAAAAAPALKRTSGFPKDWAGIQLANDDPMAGSLRSRQIKRFDIDVMSLVVQIRDGAATALEIDFKRSSIKNALMLFDDDEALFPDTDWLQKNLSWSRTTRKVESLAQGESLICPLYNCEWLLETGASGKESGERHRMARGEIWLPITLRYTDSAGKKQQVALDKVSRRLTRFADTPGSPEVVKANLDKLNAKPVKKTAPLPAAPALPAAPENAPAPGTWLVSYFSFNDLTTVAKKRGAKRAQDAFLDWPWIPSGLRDFKPGHPPKASTIRFSSDTGKLAYARSLTAGNLDVRNLEIMNLNLSLVGASSSDVRVKVKRIKLTKPVEFFRRDGSLITDDYLGLLQDAGTCTEDYIPVGSIANGSGVNFPIFVTQTIGVGGSDPNAPAWRIVAGEIIIPISVIQYDGNRVYEAPIRPMRATPGNITAELFGRG